jgi:hypothetical protein
VDFLVRADGPWILPPLAAVEHALHPPPPQLVPVLALSLAIAVRG